MINNKQAIEWMISRLRSQKFLYQEEVSSYFLYYVPRLIFYDKNNNLCIDKEILSEFKKMTPDIVYERKNKFWRYRLETDEPGRLQ